MDRLKIEKLRNQMYADFPLEISALDIDALCDLALLSLESVRSEARDRETVSDGIPERCAQAVIEGIHKGLEGEKLLAYARRPISAAIEQARALTERQFSFLDKYESGGEEQTPETDNIVQGLGESDGSLDTLIRHAKSLETRWRGAIRALSPARVAEGGWNERGIANIGTLPGETSPAPESPAKEQPGEQNAAPQVDCARSSEIGMDTLQRPGLANSETSGEGCLHVEHQLLKLEDGGSHVTPERNEAVVAAPDVASMVKRLRERVPHFDCDDGWYSCATLTCDTDRASDKCDCGADKENALRSEAADLINYLESNNHE